MSIKINSVQNKNIKVDYEELKGYIKNVKALASDFPQLDKFEEVSENTFYVKTETTSINGSDYYLEFEAKYTLNEEGNSIIIESTNKDFNLYIEKGEINIKKISEGETEVSVAFVGELNLGLGKIKEKLLQPLVKPFIDKKIKHYVEKFDLAA